MGQQSLKSGCMPVNEVRGFDITIEADEIYLITKLAKLRAWLHAQNLLFIAGHSIGL